MREDKIYVDEAGYQAYLAEIEGLKEKLNQNNKNKASAYNSAVGDGWHDNFDFEEAKREELKIVGLIQKRLDDLKNVVILEEVPESVIKIGDIVTVRLSMTNEEEEFDFKLVGSLNTKNEDEIAINSPMGRAVYKKSVGDKVSYQVGSNVYMVEILGIN